MTKQIKVMDTSFRDGFQSIFGAKVLVDDFIPALQSAVSAGLRHFETAGGGKSKALAKSDDSEIAAAIVAAMFRGK